MAEQRQVNWTVERKAGGTMTMQASMRRIQIRRRKVGVVRFGATSVASADYRCVRLFERHRP